MSATPDTDFSESVDLHISYKYADADLPKIGYGNADVRIQNNIFRGGIWRPSPIAVGMSRPVTWWDCCKVVFGVPSNLSTFPR